MPQPQILNDSIAGNPLSVGPKDGGWTRVETADNGIGPTPGKNEVVPQVGKFGIRPVPIRKRGGARDPRVRAADEAVQQAEDKSLAEFPPPRILTQRKSYQNTTPTNLKRPFIRRDSYPEDPVPAAFVGLGQPMSQGVGQYFYAPSEGNLTKNVAGRAGLLAVSEVGRGGGGPATLDEVGGRDELYSDTDLAVELGEDGYPRADGDSNFSRRPRTWRFPHKDKDVSMFPENNQTSSPQPPNILDVGNESLFYPSSLRVVASPDEVLEKLKKWFTSDKAEDVASRFKDLSPELAQENLNRYTQSLTKPASGKAISTFGEDPKLVENFLRKELSSRGVKFSDAAPAEPPKAAPVEPPKAPPAEPKEVSPEQVLEEIFKDDENSKLLQSVQSDPASANRISEGLRQAHAKLKDVPVDQISDILRKMAGPSGGEKKEPQWRGAPVDFNKVKWSQLGRYMFPEDRSAYEKMPSVKRYRILQQVQKALGDTKESGLTKDQISEAISDIVTEPKRGSGSYSDGTRDWGHTRITLGKDGLPIDMNNIERMFRQVTDWNDDYQVFSGSDLSKEVQDILKKTPTGSGRYFRWEYLPNKDENHSSLTVLRKPAWKRVQEETV